MVDSKNKGNTLERFISRDLKKIFPFCKTARLASRLLDNCKIDVSGVPMNIQSKSGYNDRRPKYEALYRECKQLLIENFPKNDPVHTYPYVLVHKLTGTRGKTQPELFQVTIDYQFFLELVEAKYGKS